MRFILALVVLSLPAFGTVIYTDTSAAADDLPSTGFPLLGTLAPGVYTVTGNLGGHATTTSDEDTFSVQPAVGNEIISEEIQIFFAGSGNSITEPILGTTNFSGNFHQTLIPASPITGVMNIDLAGTQALKCTGPGGTPPCGAVFSNYDITFTVQAIGAPVPEPSSSSLSLTGMALFALAFTLRRRSGKHPHLFCR
jgi:hypothetical protein